MVALDPKFYLTVTTHQRIVCAYCGAEDEIDLDIGDPFDGKTDPLDHDEDCERLEG